MQLTTSFLISAFMAYINSQADEEDVNCVQSDVIIRFLIVVFMLLNMVKWAYFARCFDLLQSPLYMIVETGKGMSVFTMLLIFFSTIFTFINMAIGVDKPGFDEFKNDDYFPFRSDIERHIM